MQWIVEQCLHAAGREHLGRVVSTASPPVFPMLMMVPSEAKCHQQNAVQNGCVRYLPVVWMQEVAVAFLAGQVRSEPTLL